MHGIAFLHITLSTGTELTVLCALSVAHFEKSYIYPIACWTELASWSLY